MDGAEHLIRSDELCFRQGRHYPPRCWPEIRSDPVLTSEAKWPLHERTVVLRNVGDEPARAYDCVAVRGIDDGGIKNAAIPAH